MHHHIRAFSVASHAGKAYEVRSPISTEFGTAGPSRLAAVSQDSGRLPGTHGTPARDEQEKRDPDLGASAMREKRALTRKALLSMRRSRARVGPARCRFGREAGAHLKPLLSMQSGTFRGNWFGLPLSRESRSGAPQLGTGTSSGGSITTSPGSGTSARLNPRLTKTNRCMAEGRRAFLERFAEIYGSAG
jgi:hypothetical protein